MKSVWYYIILGFLLLFLFAAKSDDHLSKYLEALDSSKAYRSFSSDDNFLARTDNTFRDKHGYFWTYSYSYLKAIYRFNGHQWQNMRSFLPEKAFPSQPFARPTVFNQQLMISYKDGVYLWQGHSFVKYSAPQGTELIETRVLGDKLLVIFDKGYAVLEAGKWLYYKRKLPEIVVNKSEPGTEGYRLLIPGNNIFTRILHCLDGSNNLFVATYETNRVYEDGRIWPAKPVWKGKNFYLQKLSQGSPDSILISRDNVFTNVSHLCNPLSDNKIANNRT
ncbi:MAG: hypothetical protein RBR69_09110 [Candidatus Cloacimonadaceae bacterium]|jgi:hypothetical protein|nr:hypothetical protein [Candidatus Cloacimonadota bacterium]MCB5255112.1 hypothetical protein [Candidatus Cloacimonadota bacterium]MCK9243552.1 hypothetical protein [Candidatus Cloacimonadota bacterium]MDD3533926.1 hypothetical protein [Candidatus Cloacimonadota bacterium]MDY0128273.1 hypothetical protein [Candidatus Cloacimonadaceae bacterium]